MSSPVLLQAPELTSSTPAWAYLYETPSSLCVHTSHPGQWGNSGNSQPSWKALCSTCSSGVAGRSYYNVISTLGWVGDASQFQQMGLFPTSLSAPRPMRLKSPQKPNCTDLKWTNTERPLPLGRHCLATMLGCWTQKPLWQSCADAHGSDVLRPAQRGLGTFIYFRYCIRRQQKRSHRFQPN